MLEFITLFLQTMVIAIGTILIQRYVLLEPPMEKKKQILFYIIGFVLITASYCLNADLSQIVVLLLGGLNMYWGRKTKRIRGFIMIIPLIGIINGAAAPILLVNFFFDNTLSRDALIAQLVMYFFVTVLLLIFYFKGKKWRVWFAENMSDRRLSSVEYTLICAAGIIMMIFSQMGNITLENKTYPAEAINNIKVLLIGCQIMTFVLTMTIIVMIMQGNRRKFYHDKVAGMQFSVITTMADIVENRDQNTGGHIKRTAKYVEIIAKRLQKQNAFPDMLTNEYLADIIVAAPLHDIGKIHIPDAILNKPGKLTDEEFDIMKTHTTAGYDVLMQAKKQLGEFEYLNVALDMAEYHHERWDGKGYPNAIKGEEIPLCARIMAVADVFDALTAKRCYKEAMPVEKAYSIIEEESGTHFDPVVAEAFLTSRKEVSEAIKMLSLEEV